MVNLNRLAKTISLALLATFISITGQGNQESAFASTSPNLLVFNDQVCDLASAGYLGDGSVDHPYQISDSDALWEITDCSVTNSSEARFELLNDIDVSQAVYAPTASPIGFSTSDTVYSFSGILIGNHKSISGISMSSTTDGVGLFGYLHNAYISDLHLVGSFSTTTAGEDASDAAGALAVWSEGEIHVELVVQQARVSGYRNVGGLIGKVSGSATIINSINAGSVSGDLWVGGLLGRSMGEVELSGSMNFGDVSGVILVGGLLGLSEGPIRVLESTNLATVSATSWYVGGLIGSINSESSMTASMNLGNVAGVMYSGGLIGAGFAGATLHIHDGINFGTVSGRNYVAGFIGYISESLTVIASSNAGSVTGTGSYVGGMVGFARSGMTGSHVANSGAITAIPDDQDQGHVGGIVGGAYMTIAIENGKNAGTVSGPVEFIGGLAGSARTSNFVASNNSGEVSGFYGVGGLIGLGEEGVSIVGSSNSATVHGFENAGGLVGMSGEIEINNSVNGGDVSAYYAVGGLVAYVHESAHVTASANFAMISGVELVGGLIGHAAQAVHVADSSNRGPIIGSSNWVGGLVGQANTATFSHSFNSGEVTGADDVGGLIGWVEGVRVNDSFNNGNVAASMVDVGRFESAGGLIGNAQLEVHIERSLNTGAITALQAAGGLIGYSYIDVIVSHSYNVGPTTVGTGGSADGLIGVASDSSLVSLSGVYTSVASTLTETTPATSMKSSGMYSGWNFDSVWGFGTCSENLGYPLLRFANQVATYFPTACYSATVTAPSAGVAVVPPKLPRFDVSLISGNPGQKLVIAGTDLDLVISGTVDSKPVSFSLISETSLEMTLPNLVSGKFSLELTTVNGRVIYQDLIEIVETETVISQLQSLVLVGLNPKSSWLSNTHISQVKSALATKASVVCIAYNDRPGVTSRKKALSRAMHACSAAKELGLETKVFVYGKAPKKSETLKILFR